MLIKLLLLAALLYFIAKAAGNLIRATLHDPKAAPRMAEPETRWQGPAPRSSRYADVEDAQWEDL